MFVPIADAQIRKGYKLLKVCPYIGTEVYAT